MSMRYVISLAFNKIIVLRNLKNEMDRFNLIYSFIDELCISEKDTNVKIIVLILLRITDHVLSITYSGDKRSYSSDPRTFFTLLIQALNCLNSSFRISSYRRRLVFRLNSLMPMRSSWSRASGQLTVTSHRFSKPTVLLRTLQS